jgi:3,4-dihydroxy-2-butanone 4-phosphate synthase/GTP cyclohydrolase II
MICLLVILFFVQSASASSSVSAAADIQRAPVAEKKQPNSFRHPRRGKKVIRYESISEETTHETNFVAECDMPTALGHFRMRSYAYSSKAQNLEPIVMICGDVKGCENVIVRVHDQCFTSEVFGSLRCDCREQLEQSLKLVKAEGGIVIYLQQEGRGIGIANKVAAYSLQDSGMDTVDANIQLGFKDELREYMAVPDILNDLGINSVRLITNNPFKINQLRELGIQINERIPMQIQSNQFNSKYLLTKRDRMNHLFTEDFENTDAANVHLNNDHSINFGDNIQIPVDSDHQMEHVETDESDEEFVSEDRINSIRGGEVSEGVTSNEPIHDITKGYAFGKHSVELAIEAIREGRIVLVTDDEGRENEGDLIMAAEKATPDTIGFIVRYSSGVLCVSMESDRLEDLKLPPMVANNEDPKQTAYTVSVDYKHGITTGISSADRAAAFRGLADPASTAADFQRPGHVFPLRYRTGGVLVRGGHTEASLDLTRLAGLQPAGVLAEVVNDDGSLMRLDGLRKMAEEHGLVITSVQDIIAYRLEIETLEI